MQTSNPRRSNILDRVKLFEILSQDIGIINHEAYPSFGSVLDAQRWYSSGTAIEGMPNIPLLSGSGTIHVDPDTMHIK